MEQILASDIDLVSRLSTTGVYDFIIVGSGIGGGILAEELVKKEKNVLLIERGGITFSTHVCNTARPDFARGKADSPEGNELVYGALKANIQTAEGSEPYIGGPMYCLGGRSNVWGLWTPAVDDATLTEYFPREICDDLLPNGHEEAFNLLSNYSQRDAIYPTDDFKPEDGSVNALENATNALHEAIGNYIQPGHQLGLGSLATQLKAPQPYRFPQGGFSSTGPILNRMYAKDKNMTVVLHTEVLEVDYSDGHVNTLVVRSATNQQIYKIAAETSTVVLSAGTLGTARIALTSGLQRLNPLIGKGLIDHEAWAMRCAQERPEGTSGPRREPMLLQSMINIAERRCLMSVTYNSNFFLGGSSRLSIRQYWDKEGKSRMPIKTGKNLIKNEDTDFDTVAVFLEFHAELDDENEVLNLPSPEPIIRIKRADPHMDERFQLELQNLCTKIRDSTLDLKTGLPDFEPAPRPSLLGIGVFSHEVGTMRMDGPKGSGVVDHNLKVHGFDNLYCCDLSVYPVSTPANPTRTLTAISLRLAKHLARASPVKGQEHNGL